MRGHMPAAAIAALRRRPGLESASSLPTGEIMGVRVGVEALDGAFDGGGLPAGGSHEVTAAGVGEEAAAALFALGAATRLLQRRPGRRGLFVQEAEAGAEGGLLYGPGLHALGIDPDRWVMVTARDGAGVLRVVDEASRSGAPAVVVGEFRKGAGRLDLKTTRRFNLAAARTGTMTLLLTPKAAGTSAALSRWRVGAAASRGPTRDLLGPPALDVTLTRNRHGRLGQWIVEWNPDERVFRLAEGGLAVARAPVDRPVGVGGDEHAEHAHRRRRQVG